jgi:hypothetical protein
MRDEFMITRQGKQYVLFAGLLDEAHNRGLRGIDTELVQVPTPENGNVAVVKATVEMEASEGSRTFSGIGDASPENVGRNIVPHIIRDDAPPANYQPPRAVGVRGRSDSPASTAPNGRADAGLEPVREAPQEEASQETSRRGRGGSGKARKSQIDLLKTLAEELRGENGVARLESRIGKPLSELSRADADEWIDRLTPAEGRE